MSPRQIVTELDKHVVGQRNAKRAVAIALRNRVRRQKLPPEMAVDVMPKNIIMIGSTGVGKTEIARRLARMSNSPFLKVEASKFTEVGYVGRDVESMIRDLTEISVDMTRQEKIEEIAEKAELNVEERILDLAAAAAALDFEFLRFRLQTRAEEAVQLEARRYLHATNSFNEHAKSSARNCAAANSTTAWLNSKFERRTFP